MDDGPELWEETIKLCRMASKDGTKAIVATPHIMDGLYNNTRSEIIEGVKELRKRLEGVVDLKVFHGADIHAVPDLVERIKKGEAPSINDSGYLLLELPSHILPMEIYNLIFELKLNKLTPIITHVERSGWIHDGLGAIFKFIELGALIQITAMSITGGFGRSVRSISKRLLKKGLVHIVASDCHSLRFRPPGMSEARETISFLLGKDFAHKLVRENPLCVVEGRKIESFS